MGLIIKRYLVDKTISSEVVERQMALEREYIRKTSELRPGKDGITFENYSSANIRLINEHNAAVQDIYREFIMKSGIAPALCGADCEPPTFDNFFTWDIVCSVHSQRLFVEIRATTQDAFPMKKRFSFLKELDETSYLMLAGRKDL